MPHLLQVLSLRQADDYARELAANSQAQALKHLSRRARFRYWQALLDRYASLQRDAGGGAPRETAAAATAGGSVPGGDGGRPHSAGAGEEQQLLGPGT